MSQIQNRIVTSFAANQGNSIAVMNQIAGGMTNIGRAAMTTSRHTGAMDAQMRAFGTTLRYAFAGSVIFGATRMLTTLRDTQRQLGLISVLAPFDSANRSVQDMTISLREFYNMSQQGAIRALTPVGEFNDGLINLFSTVQGMKPDAAVQAMTDISKAATIAQVPVQDMTKAVAGMAVAFGRDPRDLEELRKFQAGFFQLTREAPGGISAGPAFIQQLPQLAAVGRLANITPAQMFGTYLTGLRTGGTPATVARGQQFMFQSLAVPASDEAKKAMAKAGITSEAVQQRGGMWALGRLLSHARGMGLHGEGRARRPMSEEQLSLLENLPPEAIGGSLGLTGPGAEFLTMTLGRIHAVRAAVVLAGQGEKQLTDDIKKMDDATKSGAEGARMVDDAFRKFARQNPLLAFQMTADSARRQLASAVIEPLVNPAASFAATQLGRITDASVAHPDRTRHRIQGAAAAAVGGAAFLKLFRGGVGGRLLGSGVGMAGQAFVTERAIAAATTQGAMGIGASPQNPMYVIVVGEVFGGGGGGGTPSLKKEVAKGAATGAAGGGVWGAISRGLRGGARGLGRGTLRGGPPGIAAWLAASHMPGWTDPDLSFSNLGPNLHKYGDPIWGFLGPHVSRSAKIQGHTAGRAGNFLSKEFLNAPDTLRGLFGFRDDGTKAKIEGKAHVEIDLNINQAGKVTKQRVHVPVNMFNLNGNYPSNRGKPGSSRGGR